MRTLAAALFVFLLFAGCFGTPEDEDGLSRETEERGWQIQVTDADGVTTTRKVTASPFRADTDGDDLDDLQEYNERTDPRDPDTDGDGLLDGHNVRLDPASERAQDWTAAGIRYRDEDGMREFLGERGRATVSHGGNPRLADTDGDGLTDGAEVGGFEVVVNGEPRTVQTLAYIEDTDGDGLFDALERDLGLDPTLRDTDGDGVPDDGDVDPWRDARVRLVVEEVHITSDPEGADTREVQIQLSMSEVHFLSDRVDVEVGTPADDAGFSSSVLDPGDGGGSVTRGEHNLTYALTVMSQDASGAAILLDLFSATTGTSTLFGFLHMVDGSNTASAGSAGRMPWPEGDLFAGAHGTITLRLVPASGPGGPPAMSGP